LKESTAAEMMTAANPAKELSLMNMLLFLPMPSLGTLVPLVLWTLKDIAYKM
jgi:hypothetical protein